MKAKRPLRSEERDFFTLVSRAAFANPFSEERSEIDLQISGMYASDSEEERIQKALHEVSNRISRLEQDDMADINCYSDDDRNMIEKVFLSKIHPEYPVRKHGDERAN
jgi:hypothetical protein